MALPQLRNQQPSSKIRSTCLQHNKSKREQSYSGEAAVGAPTEAARVARLCQLQEAEVLESQGLGLGRSQSLPDSLQFCATGAPWIKNERHQTYYTLGQHYQWAAEQHKHQQALQDIGLNYQQPQLQQAELQQQLQQTLLHGSSPGHLVHSSSRKRVSNGSLMRLSQSVDGSPRSIAAPELSGSVLSMDSEQTATHSDAGYSAISP